MSQWRRFIADFGALAQAVTERVGKRALAKKLSLDIHTLKRWLQNGEPTRPRDVGWLIRCALKNGIDVSRFQSFTPIYPLATDSSYELNLKADLPDFGWLTQVQGPPVRPAKFCGIPIETPLGLSASPLTASEEWMNLMLGLGYGLSTFKTRRSAQRSPYSPPLIGFVKAAPDLSQYRQEEPPEVDVTFNRSEIAGFIPNLVNSLGIPSENPSEWRNIYERIAALKGGRVVGISVVGDGDDESTLLADLSSVVARARECRPPFIELNLSCPNLKGRADVYGDPSLVKRLCDAAAENLKGTGIPLVIKLPHMGKETLRDVLKASGRTVQAIALRNTVRVRPFEIEENGGQRISAFKGRVYGGLSGPCTYGLTVACVKAAVELRRELGLDFGILAAGGVATAADVIELMNVGAASGTNLVVQTTTAAIFDPLLAWKLRFHLEQAQMGLPSGRGVDMLPPRDDVEIASLKNAFAAQAQIAAKPRSTLRVSDKLLVEEWNRFVLERSRAEVGRPAKTEAPPSVTDWITIFTSQK
jgi:dihydroorotate dehydrogenase